MKYTSVEPPRAFKVGLSQVITLRDCARIELEPDEQVTFTTRSGTEYDVVRKSWGYYATPSLEHRVPRRGMRAALVANRLGHHFMVLIERGREAEFERYREGEALEVVTWFEPEGAADG